MGKRSRKKRSAVGSPQSAVRDRPPAQPRVSRSEARNAAVRAELQPLAEGERPLPVTIGAFVTVGLVVANIVVYAAGLTVRGDRPAFTGFLAFSVIMVTMAWGLWRVRYWAVLGLEALLGLLVVVVSLVALRFETVLDVVICVVIIVPAGTLFWFLVKSMARIQMPERPR